MRTAIIGLCAAAVLAGCGAGADAPAAPSSPAAGWTIYRDPVHAFSVRFPSGWHRATRSQTPLLIDPSELLLLATFPLPKRPGNHCPQVPERAGRAIGARDVLLMVMERDEPRGFPARARPMRLGPAMHTDFEACTGRTDVEQHWFQFADAGRGFYVFAAFGSDPGPARRAAAQRVLDSLRFRRPQTVGGTEVTLPDGWSLHRRPLASTGMEVLAASSFPIPAAPADRNCTPRAALDAMPPDGAWLELLEYHGLAARDRRAFGPRPTASRVLRGRPRPYECLGLSRMATWRASGRYLQAHLYLGPRATAARRRELAAVFDSLWVRG